MSAKPPNAQLQPLTSREVIDADDVSAALKANAKKKAKQKKTLV